MDNKEANEYDLDLKRFLNHRKAFPWIFIIKILITIVLIAFVYYLSNQMIDRANTNKEQEFKIEVLDS